MIDLLEEICISNIPYTLEELAECTIIDAYRPPKYNRVRKFGLFTRQDAEQTHVRVRFYGFVKESKLTGYETWNGAFKSACRASLRLEIEGKNFEEAFGLQLEFVRNISSHVTQALQDYDTTNLNTSLQFEHMIFNKATKDDSGTPIRYRKGEDPMEVIAHPEIIFQDRHEHVPSKVQICFALEIVTRLFNETQMINLQLPAVFTQMVV
ncbi:hypothetical protein NM688_g445 [Phlebia brevispora]|uniref:Uncharacterized protein n=1 Tax=Phlebia brevispora TaxID=194682 RepID=A0ACC1TE31_9APHY|nr:hypothetical protein NM688_g445 [Phlebia brevispora]